ncbi:hypothetical protein [Erwinia amylovora]|uniref:Uncharacterized protein n=2 Tax=Erwinia amylovora TaxID=552 RepID=E5B8T8_ERWAM|nr:hypothetical protein [Erwinia amylovora]CBX81893.1 hypothetical protein EAIL5_3073 [Erwinia amylovora ATCC BAA-2158]
MNLKKISLTCMSDGVVSDAEVHLISGVKCIMKVYIENNQQLNAEGEDFFECFKKIRRLNKSIIYYCKGAKINVIPSRMTRQMSKGMSAYETNLGIPARKENLVNIFEYEKEGLASDPLEQDEYEAKWFSSLIN